MSSGIYKEKLMDHFKHPRNRKKLEDPDVIVKDGNLSCGDKLFLECKIENNKIVDIGFAASGCVLSQAAASMLYEKILGKTIDQALSFSKENLLELIGIELGPNRLKCAMLSLDVLKQGLQNYKTKKKQED